MVINNVQQRFPTISPTTQYNKRTWKYFTIIFNIFRKNLQHSKYKTPDDDNDDDDNNLEAHTLL
jgi:hypothetical protein